MKKISVIFISLLVLFSINVQASEEPVKAFRNFNFGDSPEVVEEKLEKDEGIIDNKFFIGDKEYEIGFEYYEDKLYRVKLTRDVPMYDYKDELLFLAEIINKKYEEPFDVKKYGMPKKYNEYNFNKDLELILWKFFWDENKTDSQKIIKIGNVYGKKIALYIDDSNVLETKYKIYQAKEKTKKMKKEEQIKDAAESF